MAFYDSPVRMCPIYFSVGKTAESQCTCTNVLAESLSSTVIIFLVISIITFIIGFMLGNHCRITFQCSRDKQFTRTDHPQIVPEYEDVDVQPVTNAVKHQGQGLELKKNVAYGPSKSMVVKE